MNKTIDESTVRLTAGMLQVIECIILALESTGQLNRDALEYAVEHRLKALPDDDLQSLPLAMLMKFLQPDFPQSPVLKLIRGGKRPDESPL